MRVSVARGVTKRRTAKRGSTKSRAAVANHVGAKRKFVSTFTKTKRKRKRPNPKRIIAADKGVSSSSWKFIRKGPRGAKYRAFDTNIMRQVRQSVANGATGMSFAGQIALWDSGVITTMTTALYGQVPSSLQLSGTSQAYAETRPYFLSASGQVVFANGTTNTVALQLYECVCKTTTPQGPVQSWVWGDSVDEDDAQQLAAGGQVNMGVGTGFPIPVATKPSFSRRFKTTWRIDKSWDIALRPGEQHIHKYTHAINKAFENQYLQGAQFGSTATGLNTYQYVGKLTRVLMWVQTGGPLFDTGTGGVGVTTSPHEIGIVQENVYRFSQLRWPSKIITDSGTLPAATGGSHPEWINEATGVIQAIANDEA